MPKSSGLIISLFFCTVAAAPAQSATVNNPRIAPQTRTVRYEEIWRAGADDEADYLFGVIMDVATDEHQNIYLLDTQQQQVFKFSADGQYRGLVCRHGEGPGEIENTYNMRYVGGGRLGFTRMVPSVMVMVDTTGTPLPRLEFEIKSPQEEIRFGGIFSCKSSGEIFFGSGRFYLVDQSHGRYLEFLASFDSKGKELHRLEQWYGGYDFSRPIKVDELATWHNGELWDTDQAGHIFHTTARDSYVVEIRNPDGSLVGRLQRDWSVHQRSDQEKDLTKEQYSFSSNGDLPPISYDIADTDPAIGSLNIVGNELWITSAEMSRQAKTDGTMIVDVFNLSGHLLETRTIVIPTDPKADILHFLPDGRVVRLMNVVSALASANVGNAVQTGDKREDSTELLDEAPLEVILYQPVGP